MAYEIIENDERIAIHGNCLVDTLTVQKPLTIDGDLIARHVSAPKIMQRHGSLIARTIDADGVDAEILGVFLSDGVLKDGWRWKWLRPVAELPDATQWGSESSIENACRLFEHPALVTDDFFATQTMAYIRRRPSCGRARVLFSYMLEDLKRCKLFTPLGLMVAEPMIEHGLPRDWRW